MYTGCGEEAVAIEDIATAMEEVRAHDYSA